MKSFKHFWIPIICVLLAFGIGFIGGTLIYPKNSTCAEAQETVENIQACQLNTKCMFYLVDAKVYRDALRVIKSCDLTKEIRELAI